MLLLIKPISREVLLILIAYHITPYLITSHHITSHHIISYHIMSSYHRIIVSCHIISYHIIPYHIISYHIRYGNTQCGARFCALNSGVVNRRRNPIESDLPFWHKPILEGFVFSRFGVLLSKVKIYRTGSCLNTSTCLMHR